MKKNGKKYTKLVIALIASGCISGGLSYWASSIKLEDSNKTQIYNSMYEGKFLGEKIGKDIFVLGQNYLGKENLNDAQFNKLMDTKAEFDTWLSDISLSPEFKNESAVIADSWRELSIQLDFLKTFYTSSVKGLDNPTETMMVMRKNRAFLISNSSDNLPNDIPFGAETTIDNQKLEYNSPLKQQLRSQVEKTISSYVSNSDNITKSLDAIILKSKTQSETLKATALQGYLIIALVGFLLIGLSILLLGPRNKKDSSEKELFMIVNNIKDGLFMMTPEWEINGNISPSLGDLINKELSIGDNFYTFIQSKLDAKNAKLAKDYLKLLIEKNLNEKLVSSVNPLKLINVGSDNDPNMISISLSPVKGEGVVSKVLVTVSDANEEYKLTDTIKNEKTKSSNQFDFLLRMMQAEDSSLYVQFFQKLQDIICNQNQSMKALDEEEQQIRDFLVEMQGEIHTLKSQAGILELGLYQKILHDFEDTLFNVKRKEHLKRDDLHPISFFYKEILEKTGDLISALEVASKNRANGQPAEAAALSMGASLVNTVLPAVSSIEKETVVSDEIPFHQGLENLNTGGLSLLDDSMTSELGLGDMSALDALGASIKHSDSLLGDLSVLVKNASEKMNKKINLSLNFATYDLVSDERRDSLRSILMHLVNNSVAHGIEPVDIREGKNKYPVGVIQIFDEITMEDFQEVVTVHIVDDGAGLNIEKIKNRALELGLEIGDGSPSKLIPLIFEPDFTTNSDEDFFSGRGIGLNFVKSEVEKMGGSINMKMRPGNYIEFSFKFNLSEF